MLVTCPECDTKISSESEECKICGLPGAARRSLELCRDLIKRLKNSPLGLSPGSTLAWHVDKEQGSERGNFNQYVQLVDFNIGEYAHGSGYQVNIVLECRTCKEKFSSHAYPDDYGGVVCDTCVRQII